MDKGAVSDCAIRCAADGNEAIRRDPNAFGFTCAEAIPLTGGFGVACAAIEGLSRTLAGELSPQGVRVVCLRPHRIGDTLPMAPEFPKMERESFRELLEGWTLLKRLPTLAEVAETAAFLASDRAGAITGTVANLTCGSSVD